MGVEPLSSNAMSDTTHRRDRLDGIDLPSDLADAMATWLHSSEGPTTLGDALRHFDELVAPSTSLDVADFFLEGPSRHAVRLDDGGGGHVPCVLDAFVLASVVDEETVWIDSGSPVDGTVVTYRVTDEEVTVTPAQAVVSLGVAPADVESPPNWTDAVEDPGLPSCGYINSFPDDAAYDEWAAATNAAAVMALSVADAVAVAREIADGRLITTA